MKNNVHNFIHIFNTEELKVCEKKYFLSTGYFPVINRLSTYILKLSTKCE